jgi:F0F1-type ATP synthase assembly protein I
MYWAARASGIGFQMAVPPAVGFWLDSRWGTAPWLILVGACLGFAAAMLDIVKLARHESHLGKMPQGPSSKNDPK